MTPRNRTNVSIEKKIYQEMQEFLSLNREKGEYYPHNLGEFLDMAVSDLIVIAKDGNKWQQAHYDLIKLKVLSENESQNIADVLIDRIRFVVSQAEARYKRNNP